MRKSTRFSRIRSPHFNASVNAPVDTAMYTPVADGPRPVRELALVVHVRRYVSLRSCIPGFIFVLIIPFPGLCVSSSHANISPDTNTATLVGNHLAQSCAFRKSREFLCAIDSKGIRSDFESEVDVSLRSHWATAQLLSGSSRCRWAGIFVLGFLNFFVEIEVQSILALVAHR